MKSLVSIPRNISLKVHELLPIMTFLMHFYSYEHDLFYSGNDIIIKPTLLNGREGRGTCCPIELHEPKEEVSLEFHLTHG